MRPLHIHIQQIFYARDIRFCGLFLMVPNSAHHPFSLGLDLMPRLINGLHIHAKLAA